MRLTSFFSNKMKLIWGNSFHQNMQKDQITNNSNSKKCLYMDFYTLRKINEISAVSGRYFFDLGLGFDPECLRISFSLSQKFQIINDIWTLEPSLTTVFFY